MHVGTGLYSRFLSYDAEQRCLYIDPVADDGIARDNGADASSPDHPIDKAKGKIVLPAGSRVSLHIHCTLKCGVL